MSTQGHPARGLDLAEDDRRDGLGRGVVDGVARERGRQVVERVRVRGHPERYQDRLAVHGRDPAGQVQLARVPERIDGAQDDQVCGEDRSHGLVHLVRRRDRWAWCTSRSADDAGGPHR